MNILSFNNILNKILNKEIYTVYHNLDEIDSDGSSENENVVENETSEFSISEVDDIILQIFKNYNFVENLQLENYFVQKNENEYIILHKDYKKIENLFHELQKNIYFQSVPTLFIKYYANNLGFEYTYLTLFENPKIYLVLDYSDNEINIYYSTNLKKLIEETEYCCGVASQRDAF